MDRTGAVFAKLTHLLARIDELPTDAYAKLILEQSDEQAVTLLKCGSADPSTWIELATTRAAPRKAGWFQTACAEVLTRRVPLLRRQTRRAQKTEAGARVYEVLLTPVEPPTGPPAGVLIVERDRPFSPSDVDYYRLLGLSISEIFARPRGEAAP